MLIRKGDTTMLGAGLPGESFVRFLDALRIRVTVRIGVRIEVRQIHVITAEYLRVSQGLGLGSLSGYGWGYG